MCGREKEESENLTAGVRTILALPDVLDGFPRHCLALDSAHAPSSALHRRTQWCLGSSCLPFLVSQLLWNPRSECLISTLICKTVPFRIYVSEWDTEGELINSVSCTGEGLGIYRGKPKPTKGEVEEVIAGCVECHCVHSKTDYVLKYVCVCAYI